MRSKSVVCKKCHKTFEVEEAITSYSCPHCHTIHVSGQRAGEAEEAKIAELSDKTEIDNSTGMPESSLENLNEAEHYKLQAEFILHQLQANISVYGSNSALTGCQPADVDLSLKYINRSLELFPDSPTYLNLKALLLIEGKGRKDDGIKLLERAAQLNPRDITIQDNLEKAKSSACFVATAAYGSEDAWQVAALRC